MPSHFAKDYRLINRISSVCKVLDIAVKDHIVEYGLLLMCSTLSLSASNIKDRTSIFVEEVQTEAFCIDHVRAVDVVIYVNLVCKLERNISKKYSIFVEALE